VLGSRITKAKFVITLTNPNSRFNHLLFRFKPWLQ